MSRNPFLTPKIGSTRKTRESKNPGNSADSRKLQGWFKVLLVLNHWLRDFSARPNPKCQSRFDSRILLGTIGPLLHNRTNLPGCLQRIDFRTVSSSMSHAFLTSSAETCLNMFASQIQFSGDANTNFPLMFCLRPRKYMGLSR